MTRLVIRDLDVVVTVDGEDRILSGASITIEDGTITAISTDVEPPAMSATMSTYRPIGRKTDGTADGARVIDGRGKLALPGLVNLHTHLPMTLLRGLAEGVDLQGFLRIVWAAEGAVMDPDTVTLGATLGALESLLGGCTTQLDMYFHHEAAHAGALATGARHVTGPVFFEGPGPDGLTWEQRIAGLRAWPGRQRAMGGPALPTAAMPHSTYTVTGEHLKQVRDVVATWGREDRPLLNTHASENAAENADTLERFEATPVQLLHAAGWFAPDGPRIVLAHGVHIDEVDEQLLTAATTIAHCPGSNLKLASGALPWRRHHAHGQALGIGTDGCSSSNDLDMWQAMRQAALLARLTAGDPTAGSAREVLRAATIEGARALGMADLIGSIEVGKRADITLIDLRAPHLTPVHDVEALLVFAAGRGDVTDVLVDGIHVVRGRRATLIDQEQVMAAARERAAVAADAARRAQRRGARG